MNSSSHPLGAARHRGIIRMIRGTVGILALFLGIGRRGHAQQTGAMFDVVPDSLRERHLLHVSPHLIVFDPSTTSATLAFSNTDTVPKEADIVLQYGYHFYPNTDTTLFPTHWTWLQQFPQDTVNLFPKPTDHYAGRWISGLPTHIILGPHQTRRVTIRITPPPHLPNGEYSARIVTIVTPLHRGGPSHDSNARYQIPVKGNGPPPIRDSVRIFYRQGPQTMGLRLSLAKVQIDTTEGAKGSGFVNPLRLLLRIHLTGTTHFEGYLSESWHKDGGGNDGVWQSSRGNTVSFQTDGIMRILAQSDELEPGHYTMVVTFTPWQDEFPASQRVPMQPVHVSIPFEIPARTW
ncbi:MAG TPA: hypothetical protein VNU46_00690 [Gemmatimonadaceae bacterium]|jgi:hypothetical protein|nr:hypothetical protein [Gemmatimonadaceae bacterium]